MNLENSSQFPWLTLVTLLPLLGALLLTAVPRVHEGLLKGLALGWSLIVFVVSLPIYFKFDPSNAGYQLTELHEWIPAIGVQYALGVDGISLWLVMLSTFLTPIILLGSQLNEVAQVLTKLLSALVKQFWLMAISTVKH
jgi:NADH-quinone oxidoreductase subunit M